jgi:hypothetical protein
MVNPLIVVVSLIVVSELNSGELKFHSWANDTVETNKKMVRK